MSDPDFVQGELDILIYWIRERDRVRTTKEAGAPKPWSADAILRNHRWCNVRRLDDRVSRWLFDHWYDDASQDLETQLIAAVLARLVNWPDTLATIAPDRAFALSDLNSTQPALAARAQAGLKTFTGAYIIPGVPGQSKPASVVSTAANVHREANLILSCVSMQATWSALMCHDGLGSFLAGQIVADLAHLRTGASWADSDHWAPLGPGSARGMNRLLGLAKDKAISQREFNALLAALTCAVRPEVEELWADRRLQAMDFQNCLCEFDKYRRRQLGEGKVRARYDGEASAGTAPSPTQGSLSL